LVTCKEFLQELNEYLDETIDPETKKHWQEHVDECPNCYVIVDTTRKTLQVFKGMQEQEVPDEIRRRVWTAIELKMAAKKAAAKSDPPSAESKSAEFKG
jgi:anti-sigma factor (TIGR02949 family)